MYIFFSLSDPSFTVKTCNYSEPHLDCASLHLHGIIHGNGKYAHKETGDKTSSIDRIIAQGFDGVYLDNADSCMDDNWDAVEEYWSAWGGMPTKERQGPVLCHKNEDVTGDGSVSPTVPCYLLN